MKKTTFLTIVILLVLPLLFFCQKTCLEEARNNNKHSICDTEKNILKNWINKVSSKEHLKEDSSLTPIDSCRGDIRGEALVCSWGQCEEQHTGPGQARRNRRREKSVNKIYHTLCLLLLLLICAFPDQPKSTTFVLMSVSLQPQ